MNPYKRETKIENIEFFKEKKRQLILFLSIKDLKVLLWIGDSQSLNEGLL